jgi:signal transduction histidine kinase
MPTAAPSDRPAPTQLQDLWLRLLLSPAMGVVVPTVSGLVDHRRHSAGSLVASYAYFSVLAFVVWEGNRRLYYKLSRREDWLERPWYRAGLLMTVIVVFTIPVSAILLLAWQQLTGDPGLRSYAVPTAVVGIVAIAAVITNVYETVFLVRGWESARLRSARAESERLSAELDRLTREVDPHFLFNNLHALQHLVETGDRRAVPFIEALTDTYRYMLASRNGRLVSLSDELRALEHHHLLAATRYGGLTQTEIIVDATAARHLYLPPVSLGELLQNALKHNDVTKAHPLVLQVSLEGEVLVVANAIRPRARRSPSTGVGLSNLADRVRLFTGKTLSWGTEDGRFVVRLPLVDHADMPTEPD